MGGIDPTFWEETWRMHPMLENTSRHCCPVLDLLDCSLKLPHWPEVYPFMGKLSTPMLRRYGERWSS